MTHDAHESAPPARILVALARACVSDVHAVRLPTFKREFARTLRAHGWTVDTRYKVASRGTNDAYRGVIDLLAYPPADGAPSLPPPFVVELEKATIGIKTLAKLAAFDAPHQGRVVIILRAPVPPTIPFPVDIVLTLA